MKKYCTHCGNEVAEDAVVCMKCGCALSVQKNDTTETNTADTKKKSKASLILGILGIVFAWVFALVGHVLSIVGIVLGIKEYKVNGNMSGLVVSIVGEVCAIISSVIGAVVGAVMFSGIV